MKSSYSLSDKFSLWFDKYWLILLVLFGIVFTFFLALFKPGNGIANY